jgi:hypothetical protein
MEASSVHSTSMANAGVKIGEQLTIELRHPGGTDAPCGRPCPSERRAAQGSGGRFRKVRPYRAPPAEAHVASSAPAQMARSAATNGEASLPISSGAVGTFEVGPLLMARLLHGLEHQRLPWTDPWAFPLWKRPPK